VDSRATPTLPAERHALLRRALALSVLSIALSGAFGSAAVGLGIATGSLSLLGFGIDAAIDSVASIVLFWRFRTEAREPHRAERIERLAETAVGGVLLVLAAYLTIGAISAITSGAHPETSPVRGALLIAAVVLLAPLAVAKYRVAKALSSGALRADSILTAIAALLGGIGLASLVVDQVLEMPWADPAGALVIAAIVAREGWSSLRAARSPEPLGLD
jgi:divalent metal cation (Fe/Co/Zn/Cd) transporter